MTDRSTLIQPDRGQPAHAIHLVDKPGFDAWLSAQPEAAREAVRAQGFTGEGYQFAILPGDSPAGWQVVAGVANSASLSSWCLARLGESLPDGTYRLAGGEPGPAMLGWMTAHYRFDRYKSERKPPRCATLLTGEPARADALRAEADAVFRVRDMVNAPAEDMGPAALEAEADALARDFAGARLSVMRGDALLTGCPMIHAVGRAAAREHAPRLIELEWGDPGHPRLAVIGKGVSFDSGGLDIKSAAGMALMKKDMGGAAHALALARLVMAARLPVRLHLLVPAVENAIAGNAFRPGDVLRSRKGLTVEITNTDAEGRLVLADAITRAGEEKAETIIDFATLTGAARVALGPDLPALFARDDALARGFADIGAGCDDPVWPLPLWKPYGEMLASDVADCVNSAAGAFAGASVAALFLDRFVPADVQWLHLDTFAWRPSARPGRPKGGDALGLRAAWRWLQARYAGPGD